MPNERKIRIRYLLPEMKMGGAEGHVIRLASALRKRGHDAGIACIFREGPLAQEARREGIPFDCLETKYKWGPRALFKIFNWLRRCRPEILHTYLFGFDFFGTFPARLLNLPATISSRREIAHWQKKKHLRLVRLGNLFADRIICCSEAARQWTIEKEKIDLRRIPVATLYNGIDLSLYSQADPSGVRREFGIPQDAALAGTVANFSPEKGYEHLLAAAALVLEKNPKAWFLLVGGGPLLEEMKSRAAAITGNERIIFTGYRSNIPEMIRAMDVFVLASTIEGFPNVLLEAMAAAKAVIATETGGIPELIRSGNDGLLVPPKNGPLLAEAVLLLFSDPVRAQSLGLAAREKMVGNFSLERMVDQYEQFYFLLLEEKERKR